MKQHLTQGKLRQFWLCLLLVSGVAFWSGNAGGASGVEQGQLQPVGHGELSLTSNGGGGAPDLSGESTAGIGLLPPRHQAETASSYPVGQTLAHRLRVNQHPRVPQAPPALS